MPLPPADPLGTGLFRLGLLDWQVGRAAFPANWMVAVPEDSLCFYVITAGQAQVWIDGGLRLPTRLRKGELALLMKGHEHRIGDCPDMTAVAISELSAKRGGGGGNAGGESRETAVQLVYGHLSLKSLGFCPFADPFPEVVRMRTDSPGLGGVEPLLGLLHGEMDQASPGWGQVVNKVGELIFLQAVRAALRDSPGLFATGHWLLASTDPQIGPVLAEIHRAPRFPWTVLRLARVAHMAKSAFSTRFRELAGVSPLSYVTKYRMQIACRMLSQSELGIRQIAASVGYESASSFSNAFKRSTGQCPADFRRMRSRNVSRRSDPSCPPPASGAVLVG